MRRERSQPRSRRTPNCAAPSPFGRSSPIRCRRPFRQLSHPTAHGRRSRDG
jgi:hypothetical protein